MDKLTIYEHILNNLGATYNDKNHDYGDSVGGTYSKYGDISFLVRITDKFNRIQTLVAGDNDIKVKDEKIDDTILDLANYCILWLVEREYKATNKAQEVLDKDKSTVELDELVDIKQLNSYMEILKSIDPTAYVMTQGEGTQIHLVIVANKQSDITKAYFMWREQHNK